MNENHEKKDELFDALADFAMLNTGPLLEGELLAKTLGFKSKNAMRLAIQRDLFPVVLMALPHRHRKFALAEEVIAWLLDQRIGSCSREINFDSRILKRMTKLRRELYFKQFGYLLHEEDLIELLGLRSVKMLRKDYQEGRLPLPIFKINNRRGKLFCLLVEIIPHLEEIRKRSPD